MKYQFKKYKLPAPLRRALEPRSGFLDTEKGRFLAAFDARFGTRPSGTIVRWGVFARVLAGVLILLGSTFGASVYADTKDVPADSILYPLKRLTEDVQLTLAPAADKPVLQATFATRRATEINDLEERNPSSTIITHLTSDLHDAVDNSIGGAEHEDLHDGNLSAVCDRILSLVVSSSPELQTQLVGNTRFLSRFNERCLKSGMNEGKGNENGNDNNNNNATSTPQKGKGGSRRGSNRRDGGEGILVPPVTTSTTSTVLDDSNGGSRHGEDRGRSSDETANINTVVIPQDPVAPVSDIVPPISGGGSNNSVDGGTSVNAGSGDNGTGSTSGDTNVSSGTGDGGHGGDSGGSVGGSASGSASGSGSGGGGSGSGGDGGGKSGGGDGGGDHNP